MKKLVSQVRAALDSYKMIEPNDRIAIGVSGGKDSLVLLCAMAQIRRFYPIPFDIVAITIDPCFSGLQTDYSQIQELCRRLDVKLVIKRSQIGQIVFDERKEKNPCSLCARMRRGLLHDTTLEAGCNKIALGHHFDDAVQTFFMNLFNEGRIGCFSPVTYLSRKNIHMIRPLVFCEETLIQSVVNRYSIPVEKSRCPADGATERENTKDLLSKLEKTYPDLKKKVLGAMQRANLNGWQKIS